MYRKNFPNFTSTKMGLGIDLTWGTEKGFITKDGQDEVGEGLRAFLQKNINQYDHFFFSFQPKNYSQLDPSDYIQVYKKLLQLIPKNMPVGLHHTMLNMAGDELYPKQQIVDFTNILIHELGLKWVNEDLGIWSLNGKSLPYPLPPILTSEGLKNSIENIEFYMNALVCPLLVEFPGFTDGGGLIFGEMNAFSFFEKVAKETNCAMTLDTGHLLGYWYEVNGTLNGFYNALSKLPLDHCFEIHLSGSKIKDNRFYDLHNGVLIEEQIGLLGWLLENCQNVRAVSYEDPVFHHNGSLIEASRPMLSKARNMVENFNWEQVI
ncbi:MAG: DUF692 family protein [Halobacteriovoraceae bacterium]|nr:DUF692 family protein [Halobacteriovoraceae bacterium]